MEKLRFRSIIATNLLAVTALTGCTIDSYLNDPLGVRCDGKRTISDLAEGDIATFIVHGENEGEVASVHIRREDNEVSVKVDGDVTGPPQQLEDDGYTAPTPISDGSELATFGAGGAWVIDARDDSVVIQGSCDGI